MAEVVGLTDVLKEIEEDAADGEICLGQVVEGLESKGYGPVLLGPALVILTPIGTIPLVPSLCGVVIFLVAIQMVFGKSHPWLPSFIKDRSFDTDKFRNGIGKAKNIARKIDRFFHPRLEFLLQPPSRRVVALSCGLLGLSMIPLELLPWAAALPAAAVTLAALGLSTEDGLLVAVAGALSAGAVYLLIVQWPF